MINSEFLAYFKDSKKLDESKKLQSICIGDVPRLSKRLACHKKYSAKFRLEKLLVAWQKKTENYGWKIYQTKIASPRLWIGWSEQKRSKKLMQMCLSLLLTSSGISYENQKKNHCFIMANRSLFSGIIPWVLRPLQIHNKKLYLFSPVVVCYYTWKRY